MLNLVLENSHSGPSLNTALDTYICMYVCSQLMPTSCIKVNGWAPACWPCVCWYDECGAQKLDIIAIEVNVREEAIAEMEYCWRCSRVEDTYAWTYTHTMYIHAYIWTSAPWRQTATSHDCNNLISGCDDDCERLYISMYNSM